MALNTDYAIRTGAFHPVQMSKDKNMSDIQHLSHDELKQKALERYQEAKVLLLLLVVVVLLLCQVTYLIIYVGNKN